MTFVLTWEGWQAALCDFGKLDELGHQLYIGLRSLTFSKGLCHSPHGPEGPWELWFHYEYNLIHGKLSDINSPLLATL